MHEPSFSLIREKIQSAQHILVAGHVSADFDAVCAVLSLGRMLARSGKKVSLFLSSFLSPTAKEVPGAEAIRTKLPKEKVDLVFGVDHAKVERLAIDEVLSRDSPFFITIDHHPAQSQGGNLMWVDTTKASTTHMLYILAKELGLPIDSEAAALLLLGLVSDTDGLSQDNATPEAIRVVAELQELGASLSKAQTFISEWASPQEVNAFAAVVGRAKIDYGLRFLSVTVSRSMVKRLKVDSGVISGFANALRMLRGVEISLLLVEEKSHFRVHLRSRAESKIDLGKIASHFDGGGHFHAAGFKSSLPARTIISKIKALLVKEMKR